MILVDANLLIYAMAPEMPEHAVGSRWLEEQLNGAARVGIPWATLITYLRVVSNRRLFERPSSLAEACGRIAGLLALPNVWTPQPTERHGELLASLLERASSPGLVPDAHLAALSIEHGLTVASADGDFARFEGVRWVNPLREGA